MPGVSLFHSKTPATNTNSTIELDSLLFFDHYSETIVFEGQSSAVGFTGYESYPVATYETNDYLVLLEGHLYDVSDVRSASLFVAKKLFNEDMEWLLEWLLDRDAEFVLVAVEKDSGDTVVLNDPLSRLPLYTYSDEDAIYLSREIAYILETADVEPDSMGIAQYLLFGYPLGKRTLYDGVTQVPPASFIRLSDGEIRSQQLSQIDIEAKRHADKSIDENAARLSDLIASSVRRRASSGTNVVSLSGGLDSRALAACMTANELPYVAATYNRGAGTASEVQAAEEVMSVLDGEWHEYQLEGPTAEYSDRLLELKRGMNTVGMAYILEFFERLRSDFEDGITYFTGDGGAKFSSWTPPRNFDSNDDIVEYLLADQTRFSMELVEKLSIHSRDEIEASIHERLESYPESDAGQRFVHFLIKERSLKWGYHGEDRNRYYFWSAAPLYAYPVFEYAMSVPDSQKKQNKLYSRIIESYSADVLDVSYVNYGAPVGSLEYKLKSLIYDLASKQPSLRETLIKNFVRSDSKVDEVTAQSIQDNAHIVDEYSNVLSPATISKFTDEETPPYSPKASKYLLTVLLVMNDL
ncbi:asparagine synthase-related protein [Natrarchaeobius oligotrophus]|uniref:Asparagine synthetase domain-containing protein n=1 Tax=Natrarchaeobius chitinivorans TaxID=1679083 RepID=A0A3N6M6G3_NATCH|nr:asparagine synthase-related protein [Natrarchaeobius chitinivorans]RQG96184.1 hypothetical protein EA472_20880 [Natrarchaeobius chitinivorans]